MIVTIAGCGALGSIFASKLMDAGITVQAFQRKGATQEALKEGLTIESEDGSSTRNYQFLAVSHDPSCLKPSELIIVLVKSFATAKVYPVKEILEGNGVVLTLQNGIGNAETLSSIFGEERVCAGVVHYGAIRRSPGVVREAGGAFMAIGPWKSGISMRWVSDILQRAGFNAEYVEDPRPFIWKKLAVNSMVNTTAALTGFNNAGLMNSPFIMDLMKRIGSEAIVAAERAGVEIDPDDLWEGFIRNITRTASNIPSMLQDNRAGRKMEVDTIPGGVLRYARDGSEFPYTRAMYAILKAIDSERGY